mmetsp:Transcript_7971/g.24513  ORF Transcript_7971/g.24513 Transcript_7971/m.24513 type:complete len:213 (+) Transcript_7971:345-983(+)
MWASPGSGNSVWPPSSWVSADRSGSSNTGPSGGGSLSVIWASAAVWVCASTGPSTVIWLSAARPASSDGWSPAVSPGISFGSSSATSLPADASGCSESASNTVCLSSSPAGGAIESPWRTVWLSSSPPTAGDSSEAWLSPEDSPPGAPSPPSEGSSLAGSSTVRSVPGGSSPAGVGWSSPPRVIWLSAVLEASARCSSEAPSAAVPAAAIIL